MTEVELIAIEDIVIGTRMRKELGDISKLMTSIAEIGLLQPIVVTSRNELICGARRHEAHKRLGKSHILARRMDIETIASGECDENEVRKQLNDSERMSVIEFLLPRLEAEAKERRDSNLKQNLGDDRTGKLPQRDRGPCRDQLAAKLGVSSRKVQCMLDIVRRAHDNPELFGKFRQRVEDGQSISAVHRDLTRAKKSSEKASSGPSNVVPLRFEGADDGENAKTSLEEGPESAEVSRNLARYWQELIETVNRLGDLLHHYSTELKWSEDRPAEFSLPSNCGMIISRAKEWAQHLEAQLQDYHDRGLIKD